MGPGLRRSLAPLLLVLLGSQAAGAPLQSINSDLERVIDGDREAAIDLAARWGLVGLDRALLALAPRENHLAPGRRLKLFAVDERRDIPDRVPGLQIACTDDGAVHLAWSVESRHPQKRTWSYTLWTSRRAPNGAWSEPIQRGSSLRELRLIDDQRGGLALLESGSITHPQSGAHQHYDIRLRRYRDGRWSPPASAIPYQPRLMHGFDAVATPHDGRLHLFWLPWRSNADGNTLHHQVIGEPTRRAKSKTKRGIRLPIIKTLAAGEVTQLPSRWPMHSPAVWWTGDAFEIYGIGQRQSPSEERLQRLRWRGADGAFIAPCAVSAPLEGGLGGAECYKSELLTERVTGFDRFRADTGSRGGLGWISYRHDPGARPEHVFHLRFDGHEIQGALPLGRWHGGLGRTRAALTDSAAIVTWGGGVYLITPGRSGLRAAPLAAPLRRATHKGVADLHHDVWRVAMCRRGEGSVVAAWAGQGDHVRVWEGRLSAPTLSWDQARWGNLAGVGLTTGERAWLSERLLERAEVAKPERAACLRHFVIEGMGNAGGPKFDASAALRGAPAPTHCVLQ